MTESISNHFSREYRSLHCNASNCVEQICSQPVHECGIDIKKNMNIHILRRNVCFIRTIYCKFLLAFEWRITKGVYSALHLHMGNKLIWCIDDARNNCLGFRHSNLGILSEILLRQHFCEEKKGFSHKYPLFYGIATICITEYDIPTYAYIHVCFSYCIMQLSNGVIWSEC